MAAMNITIMGVAYFTVTVNNPWIRPARPWTVSGVVPC